MAQTVKVLYGVTLPSTTNYASRRVDLELTLDIKKGESPQKAMERVTKEVMSFMGGTKNRRHLGQLEKVIESGID